MSVNVRVQGCAIRVALIASVAALTAVPAWPAEENLEEGFLNPPPQAYPGGNIGVTTNAEALRAQLAQLKSLGIHDIDIATASAPGPYLSDDWKRAIADTVATSRAAGFAVSVMTSPGFSHTGDSHVQPEEAMKKLVWSQTNVQGGTHFSGKLPQPPDVAGPYQNIPYFNESPWRLAMQRHFYRDVAVIAYRDRNSDATPAPVVTSNQGPVDARRLTANDPQRPLLIESKGSAAWLQLDYEAPRTVRTAVLTTPETLFEGSIVAALLAKTNAGMYQKVATFDLRSAAQVTLSFAPVTSASFRVEFSRLPQSAGPIVPKGGRDIVLDTTHLPFGPKYPQDVFAISAFTLLGEARVNEAERKAGFFTFVNDYYALRTEAKAVDAPKTQTDIVDLSARMQSDGTLDWNVPAGTWRILRFGYSPTGTINHPAPPDATGLEADKLNAAHMTKYLDRYLDGALPARDGVDVLFADSIEAGPQNWTDDMAAEFRKRRGYDLTRFMPVLAGVIVDDAATSDKFLWDYRQTLAGLLAENTYGKLSEIAHARGLKTRVQALEQARHQLGDDLEMRRYADEPMAALWGSADPVADYLKEYPNQVADQRGAASAAHLYGRTVVASESGTTLSYPGAFSPRVLKQIVDLEFALGSNWLSRGAPMPRDLWAQYAQPWMRYLARTSFLLQQGRYVADVAYFYGEDAPLVSLHERLNNAPRANGFDYINAPALLNLVAVRDGRLVTPSGMQYRVLQLGGSRRKMTVPVLRRLRALVETGLVVAGTAPDDTPSLADKSSEFHQLRDALWGADGKGHALGKGRVYGAESIDAVLAAQYIAPDLTATAGTVGDSILFQHRKLADADVYFVTNRTGRTGDVELSFRQVGAVPQLWRATTGERTEVSYRIENGRTVVPLTLYENDAIFVVFRKAANANVFTAAAKQRQPIADLSTDWTVHFGASTASKVLSAGSWSESADADVRYFAGTATYARTVTIPATALTAGEPITLDLGEVQDIAEVKVNGTPIGVRWTPPYVFDITQALVPGENTVEIAVTDRLVNRLIGAAKPNAPPASPFGSYAPDAPLRRSGLIGPVTVSQ